MHKLTLVLLFFTTVAMGQSKSISDFRSDFKESSNVFLYSSTLRMLNPENNPDFADLVSGIEEIRILNYDRTAPRFGREDLTKLRADLEDEGYEILMKVSEKENGIDLMGRQKRGRNIGMVAIVENEQAIVLIDIVGSLDMEKFMQLWQKIDAL